MYITSSYHVWEFVFSGGRGKKANSWGTAETVSSNHRRWIIIMKQKSRLTGRWYTVLLSYNLFFIPPLFCARHVVYGRDRSGEPTILRHSLSFMSPVCTRQANLLFSITSERERLIEDCYGTIGVKSNGQSLPFPAAAFTNQGLQ